MVEKIKNTHSQDLILKTIVYITPNRLKYVLQIKLYKYQTHGVLKNINILYFLIPQNILEYFIIE